MLRFPHAKINLGLYVTERRPDGYHNILSCFYPIPWHDAIEAVPAKKDALYTPNMALPPSKNLVWKVWKKLRSRYDLPPLRWALLKSIPAEAGLGGGSADAAFALRMVNDCFQLDLSSPEQIEMLAPVTADGPFFLQDRPAIVEGIGEKVTPFSLSLKGWQVVVVKPPQGMDTRTAYQQIRPRPMSRSELIHILSQPVETWREQLHNQFEEIVLNTYPALQQLKAMLYRVGASYVSMTGSGTAFYGLFPPRSAPTDLPTTFLYRCLKI